VVQLGKRILRHLAWAGVRIDVIRPPLPLTSGQLCVWGELPPWPRGSGWYLRWPPPAGGDRTVAGPGPRAKQTRLGPETPASAARPSGCDEIEGGTAGLKAGPDPDLRLAHADEVVSCCPGFGIWM